MAARLRITAARDRLAGELGFALITVLWGAMILAVIVASVLATSRTETRLTRNRSQLAELDAIADAALNIAILQLLDATAPRPTADATPFTVDFARHRVRVSVQDEAGKVDLNRAPEELLRGLLITVGLDPDAAQALVDKILDWREPGIGKRLNGAKTDDYRAAGLSYGPRNGPFESVEELQLVLGVNEQLYQRLAPSLTVYSQTPWPDPAFAGSDVLWSLPGMDEARVAALLGARVPGNGSAVLLGHAFTIAGEVNGADAVRVAKKAVIRLTGFPNPPYQIYRWN
jgi:general secretion pathway protein K